MSVQVPKGYKQTEVGVIPEDWKVTLVEELGKFSKGRGIRKDEASTGDIPCVRYGEIYTHHHDYIRQFNSRISKSVALTSTPIKQGDILFAGSGETKAEIGKCVAFINNIEAYAGGDILIFSPKKDYSIFLGYLLNSPVVTKQKASKGQGDAVVHISASALASVKIPLPDIAEQQAIAEALSDADTLIESLEQLIAKKRQIKQGAMQELLTGQRRLPGFSGEWKNFLWGDLLISCSSGATPFRGNPEYYKGNINWVSSGELNYNVIHETIEHVSTDAINKTNLKIHPPGTFLMAITGLEAAGTRGSCAILGVESATNQSCMAIYPGPNLLTSFLYSYYVLKGDDLAFKYCQGTKQQSYTANIVKLLPICIPPSLEEQKAISLVFEEMDNEITLLVEKLDKAVQIKQSMMQELLTGRIRLI